MNILVLGGGGFIFGHLAKRLTAEGHYVRVVDIKKHEYFSEKELCTEFIQGDLREPMFVSRIMYIDGGFDWVFQGAAQMGGAQYIFTGTNDADIIHDSALINLNVVNEAVKKDAKRLFFSSSACIYNQDLQHDPENTGLREDMAWPLNPDSPYGVEKGFSERVYEAFSRNKGLEIRIARFHNIMGTHGTWKGDRAKAPAAICRKVAEAIESIEIWGPGNQTRSFLYIDECIEGVLRLMRSDCAKIVNIGSEEMITINDLAKMVIKISGKNLTIRNIDGPVGVLGRNSHNELIEKELNWKPSQSLQQGMEKLYKWVAGEVNKTI